MRAIKIYMQPKDYSRVTAELTAKGESFSEFAREAVLEKFDREKLLDQMMLARSGLDELLTEIRQETARSRRDLAAQANNHLELQRNEASTSLARNEEFLQLLVKELSRLFDANKNAVAVPGRNIPRGPGNEFYPGDGKQF
ncbi:hypothetical protein [Stenotrophomonas maltophilia]|uniref:hypothetical protein n=1 Tax=Stenotrophomonas maltophilia TaxID=40324 RepID=UPI0012FD7A3A|nr:hypothetical protein [Stenotrophomonas maltophilia]